MRWIAAFALTLLLCACGRDEEAAPRTVAPPPDCPEGTPLLKARDVVGPDPRGYALVPVKGDKEVEAFVGRIERGAGEGLRGYDAAALIDRSKMDGTAVVVLNTDEGRPEDVVTGALEAEREEGVEGEPIVIDGRDGRLQRATDGSFIATAPAGRCAMVILIGLEKPLVREAAAVIGSRG